MLSVTCWKMEDKIDSQEDRHGVANLIENGTCREGFDEARPAGCGLNDSPDDVKDNRDEQELQTAKDIGNLGCSGLPSQPHPPITNVPSGLTCPTAPTMALITLTVVSSECCEYSAVAIDW